MNDELMQIGIRIANLRRAHNHTQETLSEALDISVKHLSHVERGCASLSIPKLVQLSQLLDTSVDYILIGSSYDKAISLLPQTIVEILHSDDKKEISRIQRYLDIYVELYNK